MKQLIGDTLRSESMAALPFLNKSAVRAFADRLETMTAQERGVVDSDVMILVSLILMQERLVHRGAD
jgi:hypothetical protein